MPDHSFVDRLGTTWPVAVSRKTLRATRAATGLAVAAAFRTDPGRLAADGATFAAVIYGACEQTARRRGVTPEQFADRLADVDAMGRAAEAVGKALREYLS